jgi:cytochrome c556
MRRFLTYVAAIAVVGVAAVSAQKATTPADLDAAMKRVAQNNAAVQKAVKSGDFAAAKTSVAAVKAALMDAENFWVVNKKDDAVKMSQDAIAKVTAVETALSAATPDQMAVFAALKEQGGTCTACHKQYREQDTTTTPPTYSLKAGSI